MRVLLTILKTNIKILLIMIIEVFLIKKYFLALLIYSVIMKQKVHICFHENNSIYPSVTRK